jgi:hypothetical protein
MKPFFHYATVAAPFRPEVARRLGLRAFTAGLAVTKSGIAQTGSLREPCPKTVPRRWPGEWIAAGMSCPPAGVSTRS